jgi:hypothetical protein
MLNDDVIVALTKARAVLHENGLTKGRLWEGWEPDNLHEQVWVAGQKVCALGALGACGYRYNHVGTVAKEALAETINGGPIRDTGDSIEFVVTYNDDPRTDLEDILDLYDRTISRLSALSDPELIVDNEPSGERLHSHRQRVLLGVE